MKTEHSVGESRSSGKVTAYIPVLCEGNLRMLATYYRAAEESPPRVKFSGSLAWFAANSYGARLVLAICEDFGWLLVVLLDMEDDAFEPPKTQGAQV